MKKKRSRDIDFDPKNRKLWQKFIVDGGYTVSQISEAIIKLKDKNWDNNETKIKINKIKKYFNDNDIQRTYVE